MPPTPRAAVPERARMHCPSCGFETPEGINFCGRCGTKLSPRCPHCDFENPPGFAFCGKCGASLAEPAPAAHASSLTGTTPRRQTFTPAHLAEKILHACAALEGERKQVTVLFADLKASMELLADRAPEAARQLLDPVLERILAAVRLFAFRPRFLKRLGSTCGYASLTSITVCEPPRYSLVSGLNGTRVSRAGRYPYNTTLFTAPMLAMT
jgi:hypothetical protein